MTDGERVYAWFSNGQLIVLDVAGKPVWSRHLEKEYKPFDLAWGHSSSPVLYKDKLLLLIYQTSSAFFLAPDKRNGKEIWKNEQEKAAQSYSTPLVIETATGAEAIVNSSEGWKHSIRSRANRFGSTTCRIGLRCRCRSSTTG